MEGAVKVYGSRQMAEEAIYSAQPMTAVLKPQECIVYTISSHW